MPRCIAFAGDVSSTWGDTDPLVKVRTGWIVSEDVVLGLRKPKVTGPPWLANPFAHDETKVLRSRSRCDEDNVCFVVFHFCTIV